MDVSKEKEYYSDGNTRITNSRAIFGSTTYAMSNITSVSKKQIPPSSGAGIFFMAIGMLLGIIGLSSLPKISGLLVTGGALLVLGAILVQSAKSTYIVMIASSSGESKALESKNKVLVEKIVEALNEAIVDRG